MKAGPSGKSWLVTMKAVTIRIHNSCSVEARHGKRIFLKGETYDAFYGWPAEDGIGPSPSWRQKNYKGPIAWPKPFWEKVK